jgi:putative N6-adenine-specific DNA methylase
VTGIRRRDCYAVVAPGLERIVSDELRAMAIEPLSSESGGVSFTATDDELFAANLHLRTASRILVRIAAFKATAFHELERLCRGVAWDSYAANGATIRLRVTCHKSRLYHSDGVAERVASGIAKRVERVIIARAGSVDHGDTGSLETGAVPADSVEADPAQLFTVRLNHDLCTISADSSGELLHRRGYRLATAKAPLRETLAAASLLALGYDGTEVFLDPMCGAGTIAIEAALISRRIAPGIGRTFACERWPGVSAAAFRRRRDDARSRSGPAARAPILASDRDAGAIDAARANAARAGVAGDITFSAQALSRARSSTDSGLLLTNPPYGARVGDRNALRSLYAQLGNMARTRLNGWTVALLSADRMLEGQLKVPLDQLLRFRNGGIPVRLVRRSREKSS